MPYTALPDMRMPYDNDGSLMGQNTAEWSYGIATYKTNAEMLELNDNNMVMAGSTAIDNGYLATWLIFPELREVTGLVLLWRGTVGSAVDDGRMGGLALQGSVTSTNGVDGTWESASLPGGFNDWSNIYTWRDNIKPVSFTGPKKWLRFQVYGTTGNPSWRLSTVHFYGEKAAGQTPDDIVYIDHDTTPGVEFTAPEDFGDRPLATTAVRQFRVKNVSATVTANTINIQCNDADFVISTDNATWVVTINIGSLGPGAESSTMYVRNTTPAAGSLLGPRFSRIVTTVGSWT